MQIHNLKSSYKYKKTKRIGRGGKRGSYSGKGQKGQKSRAGAKIKPAIRELIMRIPKKRGLGFAKRAKKYDIVKLSVLESKFPSGSHINPSVLVKAGLIYRKGHRTAAIKILGDRQINKKFYISRCFVTDSAKKFLELSGGTIESAKK